MLLGEENRDFSLEAFMQAVFRQIIPKLLWWPCIISQGLTLSHWQAGLPFWQQSTEPVHIAEELWCCPSSCPVKAHAPNSQFPAMGEHIPGSHVSWVSRSTLEESNNTDADHWFWCLLFLDLYEHKPVSQISVQGLGFLSSSHQRHVPCKLKINKKI